jgi:predicted RecB family nuclease
MVSRMRRITATHVYSYVKCSHLAALDLHLPRSERRPPTAWEEFAAQRGRDFEARFVAKLPVVAPSYPERDFTAGAAATLALLHEGVDWIHQAVLQDDDRLGLPDLLRRVPGASAFGDFHYEVVDVKTSGRSRGDQILQVVFYSQLLADVQGRLPTHGALVLKDGREERFLVADYAAACDEVVGELRRLREDLARSRPFLQASCSGCYHDQRCAQQLEAADDLSLVAGMSRGARAILEGLGCGTATELMAFHPEGAQKRGHLDATLVRRLRRAAQARGQGEPLLDERPRHERLDGGALVHLLTDAYADRVLAIGVLHPIGEDGVLQYELPRTAADEWPALRRLLLALPASAPILHFGEPLRRFAEQHAFEPDAEPRLEARFLDLRRRFEAAAVYQAPAWSLADYVRLALGRDPLRAGHAGAAAMWLELPDRDERLLAKLRADLDDLAALKQRLLDATPAKDRGEAASAAATASTRASSIEGLE